MLFKKHNLPVLDTILLYAEAVRFRAYVDILFLFDLPRTTRNPMQATKTNARYAPP